MSGAIDKLKPPPAWSLLYYIGYVLTLD